MDDLERHSVMIKAEALRLGFDACGIARATSPGKETQHLSWWLENGFHGDMKYMEDHFEKRTDPTRLFIGTKSVIAVLLNYCTGDKQSDPEAPVVSKYAFGKDYHFIVRKKLKALLGFIHKEIGPSAGRGFCDSAPLMDKAWAAKTGLGWIGKNTCLISPQKGSFLFIGILLVDRELHYDSPVSDHCGNCTLCIKACPTNAIVNPYLIDARKCISYLTIEHRDEIPSRFAGKFNNRLFGCDICQDVCPWNRKAKQHKTKELLPLKGFLDISAIELHNMSEEEFNDRFAGSPLKRTGYRGIRRNLQFLIY